jgi:hypothetical protein
VKHEEGKRKKIEKIKGKNKKIKVKFSEKIKERSGRKKIKEKGRNLKVKNNKEVKQKMERKERKMKKDPPWAAAVRFKEEHEA